jgi:DNA mismatch endonuclease (patch repair protein)
MRRIRSKDSRPEMVVRRTVHRMGFRYRLHDHKLPGRPDLVFSRMKKIIFVHGCFWHVHACNLSHIPGTRKNYWGPKLKANKLRDERHKLMLRELGWATLIVWECETKDALRLRRRLRRFLRATA